MQVEQKKDKKVRVALGLFIESATERGTKPQGVLWVPNKSASCA